MRVTRLFVLIALPCLLLCGCQRTGEVENQAYVLVLGMDRAEDGLLRLTARIPKVGKRIGSRPGMPSSASRRGR